MTTTNTTLFSVIIPTFNRATYVQRAIASVLQQGFPDFEILVVDDGSSDGTLEALGPLCDLHPLCLIRQDHQGAAAARNRGADAAQGEFLIFLDSDDELLPGALAAFREKLVAEKVGVACATAITVNPDGSVVHNRLRDLGPAYENQRGLFLAGTFAVRREVFQQLSGFAANCRSSQHTEFSLRLMPYCGHHGLHVVLLDEPTVRIHAHAGDHLRGNLDTLLSGALYIIRQHESQLRKCPEHFADWCSVAAVYAAKLSRIDETRRLLWLACQARPRRLKNYLRLGIAWLPPVARRVWRVPSRKNNC